MRPARRSSSIFQAVKDGAVNVKIFRPRFVGKLTGAHGAAYHTETNADLDNLVAIHRPVIPVINAAGPRCVRPIIFNIDKFVKLCR